MTAVEKAKELVNNFSLQMPVQIIPIASTRVNQLSCDMDLKAHLKNAKQCALIAVDELIKQEQKIAKRIHKISFLGNPFIEVVNLGKFWNEVKHEINNL